MTRCLALSILLFWTAPAFSADAPVIAVVGLHQPDVHLDAQQKLSRSLATTIEKTHRAVAIRGSEVGPTIQGRQQIILEEALLQEGRQLLSEGQNLYNQAQPEAAVPILLEAITALEAGVVISGELRDLWDAKLLLGTSHLALESPDRARAAFRDAIALNIARSPDPALYPPDVTDLFDEVRTESAQQRAPLTLTAPGSMELFVDGDPVGTSPVTVDLLPGTHHIRARSPGYMAVDHIALDGSPASIELVPTEPTLGASASSPAHRTRQTTALYRALGRHSEGVDFVLLAGTDTNLLHLQLYDVSADTFSMPTSIPYADGAEDEALKTIPLLLNLLDPDGSLPTGATQPASIPLQRGANPQLAALLMDPIAPNSSGTRPKKRTGLWVGIGVGILAASGTGIGLAAANSGPRYNGTVRIGPF